MQAEKQTKLIRILGRVTDYLYPLLLFLFPFVNFNRGIDVTDTTYNLARIALHEDIAGTTWAVAYQLSDMLGRLFMHLPFGGTMAGMNFYCSLLVAVLTMLAYFFSKRTINKHLVFWAELIAVGLCWCPKVILYNYLTYFLMSLAIIFLMYGMNHGRKTALFGAGFFLGLNVFVRFPNVTEVLFIIYVWYCLYLEGKIRSGRIRDDRPKLVPGPEKMTFWNTTLSCVIGYAIGFLIVFLPLSFKFGFDCFPKMIAGLFTSSETARDYKLSTMLHDILGAYAAEFVWILIMLGVVAGGVLLFALFKNRFVRLKKFLYVAVIILMLRFLWGKGMFGFDYGTYFSMIAWATIFVLWGIIVSILVICDTKATRLMKSAACMILLVIGITPLGSNNNIYPVLNNLFLIGPLILQLNMEFVLPTQSKFSEKIHISYYPFRTMLFTMLIATLIQSVGFGFGFVFRDGTDAEMNTRIESGDVMNGMYTTAERAEALTGLSEYLRDFDRDQTRAVFFGDVPGLAYLMDLRCAVSHTWPDLDTYLASTFEQELSEAEGPILLITSADMAESLTEGKADSDKEKILVAYIVKNGYCKTYSNESFAVFEKKENGHDQF